MADLETAEATPQSPSAEQVATPERGPGGSQATETPPSSTRVVEATQSSPLPVYKNERLGLVLPDVGLRKQRLQDRDAEPAAIALEALKKSSTAAAVEDHLYLPASFEGYGNLEQIQKSVQKVLDRVHEKEDMTHYDVATDMDYDHRLGQPHLWAAACARVAAVEGLSVEALYAALDSNMGFMEHTNTTLSSSKDSGHSIGTESPCLIASPPSCRKSRLIQYTDMLCTDSCHAPDDLRHRKYHMGDATTKGVRTQLLNLSRCILSSDEGANVIETPYGDKSASIHYVSKPLLCTWTQAEVDDVVTASGSVHLGPPTHMYRFQMKLAAQIPVAESIMQPKPHGFQKRPKLVVVTQAVPVNSALQAKVSYEILQKAHDFMLHRCMPVEQSLHLDGFAIGVLDTVAQAVEGWLADNPGVDAVLKAKMQFVYSDLLREAHKVHRLAQFIRSLKTGASASSETELADEIQAEAVVLGVHRWSRGLMNHAGMYNWHRHQKQKRLQNLNLVRPEDHEPAQPMQPTVTDPDDKVAQAILMIWEPDSKTCPAKLRFALKNKRGAPFQRNLAGNIQKQLKRLQEKKLIEKLNNEFLEERVRTKREEEGQPQKRARETRGESTQLWKKKGLSDHGPDATDLRKKLLVPQEKFPH